MSLRKLVGLLGVVGLLSVVVLLAGKPVLAWAGGVEPAEQWQVDNGETKPVIQNNQDPGNYKVKNRGRSAVSVRVYNSQGTQVAQAQLEPNEESDLLGVPLGGKMEIIDGPPNTSGARGTLWKAP